MQAIIPILLYHSIANEVSPGFRAWSSSPQCFEAHMRYLLDERYTPITVSQLVEIGNLGTPMPSRPVVVTFDDGLADFYSGAWPVLKQHEIPATLYVTTGYVGSTSRWLTSEGEGQRPMMDWEQIVELDRNGIELGAHTYTHPQLDTLSASEAWNEIVRSKWQLEEQLNHPVASFAYPHGYYSHNVRNLVRQAGFSSACAVKHALSNCNDDPFALARLIITNKIDVAQLDHLLNDNSLRVAPQGEQMRTKVWRLARWSKQTLFRRQCGGL